MHRIVWSLLFARPSLLAWQSRWAGSCRRCARGACWRASSASALLLSVNWLTYIWAVGNGHVVDASLGYFMTPLVNVALGYTVLHERPAARAVDRPGARRRRRRLADVRPGSLPWIGLVLGLSFGAYGLLRKVATLGALEGLTLETLILAPAGVAAWRGGGAAARRAFPAPDLRRNLWLIGVGPATTIAAAVVRASRARRLSLATLGLLQYLSPTMQFLLGVWLFREPFQRRGWSASC